MQVPHDVVVGAAVEGEDAEIGLDPVQAVVALGVQGEVAAVVVLQRPAVAVMGHAVAVEGAFVGARDVQARDLVVARREAPVRAHAAHVPHAVLAHQVVVARSSYSTVPGATSTGSCSRPVPRGRFRAAPGSEVDALACRRRSTPTACRGPAPPAPGSAPDLQLAADAVLLPDQRLVQQQNRGCRPRASSWRGYRARDGVHRCRRRRSRDGSGTPYGRRSAGRRRGRRAPAPPPGRGGGSARRRMLPLPWDARAEVDGHALLRRRLVNEPCTRLRLWTITSPAATGTGIDPGSRSPWLAIWAAMSTRPLRWLPGTTYRQPLPLVRVVQVDAEVHAALGHLAGGAGHPGARRTARRRAAA